MTQGEGMTAPVQDPFAGTSSAPSISWKNATEGTVVTMVVTDHPNAVQGKDFKTKEPAFWPANPGQTPKPKMVAVINGTVDGEERALWAPIPSAIYAAIQDAIKASGEVGPIKPGDTLSVKLTGFKPTDGDPQKLFAAKLVRGVAPSTSPDPFGDSSSGAAKDNGADWGDAAPPW